MLLPRPLAPSAPAGAVRPWPAVLVTWGPGGRTRLHAHHCWHLVVGLDADLAVATGEGERPRRCGAVLCEPDAPHAVDARGTRALIVFVDPESDAGDRLRAAFGPERVQPYGDEDAARLRELLSSVAGPLIPARSPAPRGRGSEAGRSTPDDAVARALSLVGEPVAPPPGRHPGVRRVLRHLREAPPDEDASLEALARIARLSPGRFMHAFTESVGIPLRPYLRWLRLERAGAALAAGASLGEAAYAAGFADAAHMSRTFRRMFGVSPSEVRRRSQSVQDPDLLRGTFRAWHRSPSSSARSCSAGSSSPARCRSSAAASSRCAGRSPRCSSSRPPPTSARAAPTSSAWFLPRSPRRSCS